MKRIKNRTQRIKNSKKTKVFFLCLALAFLIWIPIKLSKTYNAAFYFELHSGKLPTDKLLLKAPRERVEIVVDGATGFQLLRNHLNPPRVEVNFDDVRKVQGRTHYITTNSLMGIMSRHLPAESKVLSVFPDSLFYELGISKTRTIPVETNLKIEFEQGFNLVNDITVRPSEIQVTGPENIIDTLSVIKTEERELLDVNESIELTLSLVKFESKEVRYSAESVQLTVEVEKFTEGRLTMPFSISNLPKDAQVTTFPNEVEIVFQIPMSAYKEINKADFKVGCDYNRSEKNELGYLIPVMLSQPEFVSSIRIIPEQIEYFISK